VFSQVRHSQLKFRLLATTPEQYPSITTSLAIGQWKADGFGIGFGADFTFNQLTPHHLAMYLKVMHHDLRDYSLEQMTLFKYLEATMGSETLLDVVGISGQSRYHICYQSVKEGLPVDIRISFGITIYGMIKRTVEDRV
jgi:hypothetical protein